VPKGQKYVAGKAIRLGNGSVRVRAWHHGGSYRTAVKVSGAVVVNKVRIGHTLPRHAPIASVKLDGRRVKHFDVRVTNRGTEVTTRVARHGSHNLVITTKSS
jgi:hypothetical protein